MSFGVAAILRGWVKDKVACFWVGGAAVSRVFGRGVVFVLLDGTPLRFRVVEVVVEHSPARVPRGGCGAVSVGVVRSITVAAAGARLLPTPRGVPPVRCRRCVVVFWLLLLSVCVVVLVLVVAVVIVAVDFVDLDLDDDVLPGIPHSSQREDAPSCSYVQ